MTLTQSRGRIILIISLVLLSMATIVFDFLYASWQNTSFYFSESFLFSSFWWLFFPVLYISHQFLSSVRSIIFLAGIALMSVAIHLFAYPALVWVISSCFFEHRFPYWQTFQFGLTEHIIKSILIYGISYPVIYFNRNRVAKAPPAAPRTNSLISSLLVKDKHNRNISLEVKDVLFFSANPPYVSIHLPDRKYLHTNTLKSLEQSLDPDQFMRIHKSYIVNLKFVESFRSRQNGDYDLTMSDGNLLRLSRNYTTEFRKRFSLYHQLDPN